MTLTQRERFKASSAAQEAAIEAANAAHAKVCKEILQEIAAQGDGSLQQMDLMFVEEGAANLPPLLEEIQFPISVSEISISPGKLLRSDTRSKCKDGSFVAIRPCAEEHGNQTFLGIFLGEMPTVISISFHPESGMLQAGPGHFNPAIFVPDLNKVVFGYESWWKPIQSKADLKKITDADIQNVWYVQAAKALNGQ